MITKAVDGKQTVRSHYHISNPCSAYNTPLYIWVVIGVMTSCTVIWSSEQESQEDQPGFKPDFDYSFLLFFPTPIIFNFWLVRDKINVPRLVLLLLPREHPYVSMRQPSLTSPLWCKRMNDGNLIRKMRSPSQDRTGLEQGFLSSA